MESTHAASLPDYGPAPELAGITQWHNGPALSMASQRGKVVLVDFWTYACVNCIRTLPYVSKWYEQYKGQGLVVIGVHTPEFGYERDKDNVAKAIARFGLRYPVAQDNRYATWQAYDNQYWPAFYLVDRQGRIRLKHVGEGEYAQTEQAIRQLLQEGTGR
jgi:thiol-disulfide isomerase/thioredoxin